MLLATSVDVPTLDDLTGPQALLIALIFGFAFLARLHLKQDAERDKKAADYERLYIESLRSAKRAIREAEQALGIPGGDDDP